MLGLCRAEDMAVVNLEPLRLLDEHADDYARGLLDGWYDGWFMGLLSGLLMSIGLIVAGILVFLAWR